jgi:hypothetical protein
MNTKPISPKAHGIIDYGFAAALLVLPQVLKLSKKAKKIYALNAVNTVLYSAFTDYPLALKRIIPFGLHRTMDKRNVSALALATLHPLLRKNNRALYFHISVIAAALLAISLTDWDAAKERNQVALPFKSQ